MKILQIVPSYKPAYVYGGPIESVAKLCEGLAAAKHTVHVYTTTANGNTELPVTPNKAVLVDGVMVTYFTRITKDHTHISPALWRQLFKNCRSYNIVHIHSWWNPLVIVAAIICHARKVKVVVSPRGMLSEYIMKTTNSRKKKVIHFFAGKRALRKSYFHATSEAEYKECKKMIEGWQGFTIPNILSLPNIQIKKIKNEQFTLLFMSRIHPKKGIEFLLEALGKMNNDMLLKIAGTGEEMYMEELKQKIKALRIEDKVVWLGWKKRAEKFEELMQADLFVLISYNENFANVVIESLHVGTPVLVSDKVGLAPFVKDEKLGWVTELNTEKVVEQLEQIAGEHKQLQWIQTNSPALIDHLFSEQQLIKQYVHQYEQLYFTTK